MKAYTRVVEGVGGGALYHGVECPPLPQVNSDCVHRDEIWEIVSSILLKGIKKLQLPGSSQSLFSLRKNESIHEGWGGVVDCPPLPQANIDFVHRDEIGEIVSSILLKGFQKLQVTRLFSFPLS